MALGMGHGRRMDTCICATIDSTSFSLESVHNGPTAHQDCVQKVRERISDIYLRSFASAWCCTKTVQILTPSLRQMHRLTEGGIAVN